MCRRYLRFGLSFDFAKRQVDSFSDHSFRFGDFVLPELLHGSRHDNERSVSGFESHRLSSGIVPNPKLPRRAQGKRTDNLSHFWFVIGVPSHAIGARSISI